MRGKIAALALAALMLAAAACGSSGSSPAPLTARQLAGKIPGCTGWLARTPSVLMVADGSCVAGPETVEVATFATMGDEVKWITSQGTWYGCCVEGHLWAADYTMGSGNGFPLITRALGGRVVSG